MIEWAKLLFRAAIAAYILYLFGQALFHGGTMDEALKDVLIALTSTAIGYYLGSSQGSADKTQIMKDERDDHLPDPRKERKE